MESKFTPSSKTGGLLLAAFQSGMTEPIRWVDVTLGDLVITVASDALKAPLGERASVRLPVSYREMVMICRALDCVAPTQAMCDAMFAQAKSQLTFVPLVRTAADSAKLTTAEFALRFNEGVERQLDALRQDDPGLVAGAWKHWILHPRLVERGAVNYGFWNKSRRPPMPVQTVGAQHDASHYDYSQLLQPIKRVARRASTGEAVDLVGYIASHERVPERFLDPYKPQSIMPVVVAEPRRPVDILQMLKSADVDVVPANGWEKRGRPGFTPQGIMVHHTAGPRIGDAPSLAVCINGRPDLSGPLCHIVLARSGKVHLIAANIANHAGMGAREVLELVRRDEAVIGDARTKKYTASPGNPFFYGIEVENSGTVGDPYPPEQVEALARTCAAICHGHGWSASRVVHHRQWTSRKIDMSWRGDLAAMIAQYMDAGMMAFGMAEDPSEPMWEPEHAGLGMNCCEADGS